MTTSWKLIVLIAGLVLISGCSIPEHITETRYNYTIEDCLKIDSPFTGKMSTYDLTERDECLIEVAKNKKDVSICENMFSKHEFKAPYAHYLCVSEVAIEVKEPSYCGMYLSSVSHTKNPCYAGYAKVTGDYSICIEMKESMEKDVCIKVGKKKGFKYGELSPGEL